jgi:predicted ATPase
VFDALSHHLGQHSPAEAARILPSDPDALCTLFPVLKRVDTAGEMSSRRPPPQDATELRRRGFAAARELMTRLARSRLLIVHIDDLQWGDEDSALLLLDLLRPPDPPPALFIGSYRTQPAGSRIDRLWRAIGDQRSGAEAAVEVRAIALGALAEPEALRLAAQLTGDDKSPELAQAIAHEAAGNPFLLSELALHGRAHLASSDFSLAARLRERLTGLPEAAQRLAEVIAVAGRPIARELAACAADADPNGQDLSRLVAERFVRSRASGARVECYHDRIRETLVEALHEEQRRALHARLAAAFEAADTPDAERLAFHPPG